MYTFYFREYVVQLSNNNLWRITIGTVFYSTLLYEVFHKNLSFIRIEHFTNFVFT